MATVNRLAGILKPLCFGVVLTAFGCARGEDGAMKAGHDDGHANQLLNETSPYLLQHARNPVDWYPWSDAAHKRARKEDKPIFLSIGYSACHWCHVMERESFEDPATAAVLNRGFVSIKVDREERPDLDDVYMSSVQTMTGGGGWPLSVFLTPDLKPFFGGTYFPPTDRHGLPAFTNVLERIEQLWREDRPALLRSAESVMSALRSRVPPPAAGGEPTVSLLERAAEALARGFDDSHGGFGRAPKFPPSGAIGFLLREHHRTGDSQWLDMAVLTLDRMSQGGLYDQLGGGFHRYAVDGAWQVPHFEKMLYDNALLARCYVEAFQLTGKPRYRRVGEATLDYVIREMTGEEGGFYSSQDADSEEGEGAYYVWTRDELDLVLGPDDARVFSKFYGVTAHGNFEGANILHVTPDRAPGAGTAPDDPPVGLAGMQSTLLGVRASRPTPASDDKVLASWNGMMISAMARGYRVFGGDRFRKAAVNAGRFVLSRMMVDERLVHVYRNGTTRPHAFLDDYANVLAAMVDLYEATFEPEWLDAADALASSMVRLFWDDAGGGFYLAEPGQADLLMRKKLYADGSTPSGNAVAALALLRLSRLRDRDDYRDRAVQTVQAALPLLKQQPQSMTHMLQAVHMLLARPVEIAVVGSRAAPATDELLAAVNGVYLPQAVVAFTDVQGAEIDACGIPLLVGKARVDGNATAYVCESFACKKPMTDAGELAKVLVTMYGSP